MNKKILYRNKKIIYHVYGNGKPVMLVHGFGEEGNVWKNQIEFLKEHFFLIVPDLPGSGQSEAIDDMSMEGMAEVLHSIIHEEEMTTCIMIGHSMGGYITLAFAEKYRNHLQAFGLFHSTAYADSDEKKVTRKKGIEFIEQYGAFEFLKTSTPNLFSKEFKTTSTGIFNAFIDSLKDFKAASLIAYYYAMMNRPDRTYILNNSEFKILFIFGEFDNAVPLQDGLRQCYLPLNSFIHILKKSGHMGMLEEPDKTNRVLYDFLIVASS